MSQIEFIRLIMSCHLCAYINIRTEKYLKTVQLKASLVSYLLVSPPPVQTTHNTRIREIYHFTLIEEKEENKCTKKKQDVYSNQKSLNSLYLFYKKIFSQRFLHIPAFLRTSL